MNHRPPSTGAARLWRKRRPAARTTDSTTVHDLAASSRSPAGRSVAGAANEAVDFVVNLVHELRTPLALVDGPLQMLARQPDLSPSARDLAVVARQNCLRLMHVAEDLLELARTTPESRPADLQPLMLDDWLRDLGSAIARHPALGRLNLVETHAAPGVQVRADRRALERVVLNLVGNAIKFGAQGREIVLGSCVDGESAGVYVADQGIGIAPDDQQRIFERFRQLDASTTRRHGGIGIGLALAAELVARMRGRIQVQSSPGQGARFTVWLPCAAAADRAGRWLPSSRLAVDDDAGQPVALDYVLRRPLTAESREHPAAARSSGPPRARVVLVEDEPELRWLIRRALADEFELTVVADGLAGWEAVRHDPPEVLLTDWMVPGLDGLALAGRARELRPQPKVVLITARMNDDERVAALAGGVDDFLGKPFQIAELCARLRNLAGAALAERALEAARAARLQDEKLRAIGMLSAGLIHEINNPIAYMRTAAELLLRQAAVAQAPEAQELAGAIGQGLARVALLVNDLRVFAYPGDGNGAGAARPFRAADLLQSALRLCAAPLRGVPVEVAAEPDLIALGAEGQIIQVLVNLLTNAALALGERQGQPPSPGCPPPSLSLSATRLASGRVEIRVRDNGPGVPLALRERIFEPFFTTRQPGEGMGLGLSVSQAIVRAHGGRLQLRSCDNPAAGEGGRGFPGAEFYFDLPPGTGLPAHASPRVAAR